MVGPLVASQTMCLVHKLPEAQVTAILKVEPYIR